MYPDRHRIYRVNTKAAQEQEIRTGRRPLTQMGRALAELGVPLTCAHSPQAKGPVERANGTLQDRLVKALRRAGINDLAQAHVFLEQTFLPAHNARFRVAPTGQEDRHIPVTAAPLEQALCLREARTVGRDPCVSFQGAVWQLPPGRTLPSLAGKVVTVPQSLTGQVRVRWREQEMVSEKLPQRPAPCVPRLTLQQRVVRHQPPRQPATNHPWRGSSVPRPPVGAGSAPVGAAPSPPLRQPPPAR